MVVIQRPRLSTTNLYTRVGLVLFTMYLTWMIAKLCVQEYHLHQRAVFVAREHAKLTAQYEMVEESIRLAGTDAGIERLARAQLGLVKAEEIPVKTVTAPQTLAQAPEPVVEAKPAPMVLPPALAALARFFPATWAR
jgi:cell division protein FtsB